ncbi:MAG: hypothetical protein ACR5K9_06025 [Wolbachia sp.]
MSKKMVNVLKAKIKESKYTDLRAEAITPYGWDQINYGKLTYGDLHREYNFTINGQEITNKFINELYSKHENLISEDENGKKNYRPFAREILIEMFKNAGSTVPNDLIIEELITNYNQGGYIGFFSTSICKALSLSGLGQTSPTRRHNMDCREPDCLRLSVSTEHTNIYDTYNSTYIKIPGFYISAEFQLKFKDENVTYEDGKILLTIPKELENYKAGDDKFLDKLTDIVNKIIEYLKKLCEKLGFKFDTRIEHDSERNIKIEHKLGKPLKVIDKPGISTVEFKPESTVTR